MSRRDEFVNNLKEQIDRLNSQIDDLEARAEKASGDAKRVYEERMAQLREMARPIEDLLNRVRESGEKRWEQLEADAEKTYKAFKHSYNYFMSQMR
jgi:DNA anti-recombination protein RmuC